MTITSPVHLYIYYVYPPPPVVSSSWHQSRPYEHVDGEWVTPSSFNLYFLNIHTWKHIQDFYLFDFFQILHPLYIFATRLCDARRIIGPIASGYGVLYIISAGQWLWKYLCECLCVQTTLYLFFQNYLWVSVRELPGNLSRGNCTFFPPSFTSLLPIHPFFPWRIWCLIRIRHKSYI